MKNRPYYSHRDFMLERYGEVLHRVPVDLGLGCPNRTPEGLGGCTFCPVDGARAEQIKGAGARMDEQVRVAVDFARRRYRAKKFMAYIQAYTGTFASSSKQRETYGRLLQTFPFDAVIIGTRPDCLSQATLQFLEELSQQTDLWIELGVQTTHDRSLERINREHDWACSQRAIRALHERGQQVVAHLILGLPGESREDILETTETLAREPIDGIKLHNLHVIKSTQLATEYAAQPFPLFDELEYADLLIEVLGRLPAKLPVMRVCTDTPAALLDAPHWQLGKAQFIELLTLQMELLRRRQGDRCSSDPLRHPLPPIALRSTRSDDASLTFYSERFSEHYHAPTGAWTEARVKYVEASGLCERLQAAALRILDIGFGLGYNSLAACEAAMQSGDRAHPLHIDALEIDREAVEAAAQSLHSPPGTQLDWQAILNRLLETGEFENTRCRIRLHWGDARFTTRSLLDAAPCDLIFHDPFSTQRNSELWTVEFFERLYALLHPEGLLATYSTALPVWASLREAGFAVGRSPAQEKQRGGTLAARNAKLLQSPLSPEDLKLLKGTRKGIPYRDPGLCRGNRDILRRREQLIAQTQPPKIR